MSRSPFIGPQLGTASKNDTPLPDEGDVSRLLQVLGEGLSPLLDLVLRLERLGDRLLGGTPTSGATTPDDVLPASIVDRMQRMLELTKALVVRGHEAADRLHRGL